ncbi:Uncharacterised protein [Mycobacteroides abscessus subsp. massiliense]|nr:Uncharacterised protein [Mycobacteroides abscessus subsp. massiliense]SKJ12821.1 Uncharacterised protein [Mycobacteroides abscessus subsp. massiliense]SKL65220.1 Uncharacterised protein [Mycobacteroides abscessus subsp. massiliense]SKM01500.1 Uncharacterised protein [Mycobacteroides abscessus subsp. massiliense]SKM45560.1 Uncharacterised protein [Mycobacteroides abscessus subsp. massiliense]
MSISSAASSTVRVMGPPCASGPKGLIGYIGMRPWVGLNPTTPQKLAGIRTLPPPSVPMDIGAMPAATAAALPPEEPPAVRLGSAGLWVIPRWRLSVTPFQANSGVVVFPTMTMPSARMRCTAGLSTSHGPSGSTSPEPRRVGQFRVRKTSLIEIGTPSSRPRV